MRRLLPLAIVVVLAAGCGGSHHASGPCASGESEVVLKALPGNGQPVTSAGMQIAADIMTTRLTGLGVASPTVTVAGDEITIQFVGLHDPTKNMSLVVSAGELQFFDFEKDLASPTVRNGVPTPYPMLYSLLELFRGLESHNGVSAYYLFGAPEKGSALRPVLGGPDPTRKDLLAPYSGKERSGMTILSVPRDLEVVSGPVVTATTQPVEKSPNGIYWYLFKLPPEISSSDLKESAIAADMSPSNGQPEVQLGFTRHGAKEFQAITKAEYERGQLDAGTHGASNQPFNNLYAQHDAIVLDHKLQATPFIDYTDNVLSLGIVGSAIIGNMASIQAAKNLALILQSGSLPYTFQRVSLRICSG